MTVKPVINQEKLEQLTADPKWAREHYRGQVESKVKRNLGSIGGITDAIMEGVVEELLDVIVDFVANVR